MFLLFNIFPEKHGCTCGARLKKELNMIIIKKFLLKANVFFRNDEKDQQKKRLIKMLLIKYKKKHFMPFFSLNTILAKRLST